MANKNKKSGFTIGEILFAVMIAAASPPVQKSLLKQQACCCEMGG